MGKATEDTKIALNVSLKESPKVVFFFLNQNFHFKIRKKKNTTFYLKIKKNDFFTLKMMSGLPAVKKSERKPYLLSRIKKHTFC